MPDDRVSRRRYLQCLSAVELQAVASPVVADGPVRNLDPKDLSITYDAEDRAQILDPVVTHADDEGPLRVVPDVEPRVAAEEFRLPAIRAGDPQPAVSAQGNGTAIRESNRPMF